MGHGGSFGASRLITWQVSIIASVLGGAMAGASTRAGFKQGLIAGLLAATATVIGFTTGAYSDSLVLEFWIDQLDLASKGSVSLTVAGMGVLAATILGSWIGCHLIPSPDRH
jgi:hypothetical protein